MKWYLIDTDDGIIDEAEKKAILMRRYSSGPAKRCGKAYLIDRNADDGIGGNYWIIKECDMESEGFGWALTNNNSIVAKPLKDIEGFDDVGIGVIPCGKGKGTYVFYKDLKGYDLSGVPVYQYNNAFRTMNRISDIADIDENDYTYCVKREDLV